jgi:hypothetical protein
MAPNSGIRVVGEEIKATLVKAQEAQPTKLYTPNPTGLCSSCRSRPKRNVMTKTTIILKRKLESIITAPLIHLSSVEYSLRPEL